MKFSSSFKVGLLTLLALVLLIGVVFKVKGRTFSFADRVEIKFKDVNGMRPGAGVQMMGLRVGQVEEVIPVIDGEDSYVKVKFVITEPNVDIPKASMFSIQQSGLIGELFLEITPPKTRTVFIPMVNKDILYKDDDVEMKLDEKFYDVGKIKDIWKYSKKHLNSGGYFISYKAKTADDEALDAMKSCIELKDKKIIDYELPLKENHTRKLVIFKNG